MDKNVLKKFAIESRQELMEKVANKINRYFVDEEFYVNQNGEVYVLVNDKHTLRLTKSEYENRQLLVKRIKEITLEQVIEEAAYTWFNRIIAIRYMEIHDYLPLTKENQSLGVRVLSSKDNTPDPEIMKISNLINPDLDIEFNKEYYGTIQDNNKRFEYILLLVCKKLGKVIPQVFDGITDYIDILVPDNLLNESGYVTKLLKDVSEDNFAQVEIIGWLYQYYNITEKDRVMSQNKKYSKSDIPFATQLFTPDWIVKYMVENSLGRFWIECSEDDRIKEKWKYYVEDEKKINRNKIDPVEIKFFDPCCGSGHILVYAFEILFDIYKRYGYSNNEIAEKILKNNIYGLDIDDRAGQLSILSLLLKAREYDKNIFQKIIDDDLHVMSINESNNIRKDDLNLIYKDELSIKIIDYTLEKFNDAKETGSLIKIEKKDYNLLLNNIKKVETKIDNIFDIESIKNIKNYLVPIIKNAEILSNKYDVIVTNPPYLNNNVMTESLKKFLQKNYKDSRVDLCTAFMQINALKENGFLSMINQHSWMFLGSFENLRKFIIDNYHIENMIHLGTRAFEDIGGEIVQTTSWVIRKNKIDNNSKYFRLCEIQNANEKESRFLEFNKKNEYICRNQNVFLDIPGNPIAYWASDNVINIFKNNEKLSTNLESKTGMTTGDNNLFLREWYEINKKEMSLSGSGKWLPYNKGGGYRKWYGNLNNVINWDNNGNSVKSFSKSTIRNEQYYFRKCITWNLITTTNISVRYLNYPSVMGDAGPACYNMDEDKLKYTLGLLNSVVANKLLNIINPTMNYSCGVMEVFPYIYNENNKEVVDIVKNCIEISKEDWDSFETSWDFITHPLIEYKSGNGYDKDINNWNYKIKDAFESWKSNCEEKFNLLKQNEETLNRLFINIYCLQDELTSTVDEKDITIRKADREREIKSLISYAVGCMFGRYSLDESGLVYAGGEFNKERYKSFEIDIDNIIPLTEDNYFGDDIISRFKKFIEVVYGKENLYENLDYIAETLGKKNGENSEETIRRYFINDFYNDHVKMYQKRPIYWLFDSGKKNGFKCLIYMHRYNEGLVSKIRLDYLHRMQNTYEKELKEITDRLNNDVDLATKRELTKRQADISAKLQETNEYDEKIAHIADQKIKIDLDDGVVVNYAKFSVKNPKTGKDESILAKIK